MYTLMPTLAGLVVSLLNRAPMRLPIACGYLSGAAQAGALWSD